MSRILNPRTIITIVLILGAILIGRLFVAVPLPGIQLPAEAVSFGSFTLPNTFIATLLSDVTILLVVFFATRNMQLVPSGFQNIVEFVIEWIYDLSESIAGANTRKFFPWIMTIFIVVLISNWWELIPGFDSIGWLETHATLTAHDETSAEGELVADSEVLPHYRVQTVIPGVINVLVPEAYTPTGEEYEHAHEEHTLPTNEAGQPVAVLVPFLRAAATDLNFTIGLALISMFMVQFYGVQALGLGYFTKFINFKAGGIGFVVGVIEAISEVAKIVSFGFRLFGNVFAGQVLLFVMAFLVPWLLPVPFYGLEMFVGFIQAVVFAMLTILFMAGAVESHDAHHDDDHH